MQRGGAAQIVVVLAKFKNKTQSHSYETGGTIIAWRGGCHPVQRGGAAQIDVCCYSKLLQKYESQPHSYTPKGRHHFCTERRVPPCAAGRGCAVFLQKKKYKHKCQSYIYQKGGSIFCMERRLPPCAAGRGCADILLILIRWYTIHCDVGLFLLRVWFLCLRFSTLSVLFSPSVLL